MPLITISIMNCQSIKNKKAVFNLFIEDHQPDIIIGSESWLSPSVYSSELFPPTYNVYRQDREDGYGGVFILCSRRLSSENIPVTTTCEVTVCRIQLPNSISLILCSIYRPPNNNIVYMEELCRTLEEVVIKFPKSQIWIVLIFQIQIGKIIQSMELLTLSRYTLLF